MKILRMFKDFFFVKVVNGTEHYIFSSTKTFRTLTMIAVLVQSWLICAAFWLKLFKWWEVPQLTNDVLQSYLALGGVITILAGVVQWFYSHEKKNIQTTYTDAYKQNNTAEKLGTSAGSITNENQKLVETIPGLKRKTPQTEHEESEGDLPDEGGAQE
jgi:hypothetical protein